MMSTVMVAALSIACLFAFFDSCHGIICYECQSKNYDNKGCDRIINSKYEVDYEEDAEICMKLLIFKQDAKNVTTERLMRRTGFLSAFYPEILEDVSNHKKNGYEIDYYVCRTNRCNKV